MHRVTSKTLTTRSENSSICASTMVTKYPCIYCHKSTGSANKTSAGSKGALQCGVCELWAHYECTGLAQSTLDAFEVLISGGDCDKPFKCSSCKAALSKFNSDLNAMKVRMSGLETKQQETFQKVETVVAKQASTDSRLENIENRLDDVAATGNSSKDVFDELKERERRETSLIIHNVSESSSSDKKECEGRDLSGVQKLFNLISVKLDVGEAVKFVRREGEKNSNKSRPLKVVLRRKEDRDLVLSKSHKLSHWDEEQWRKISVVSDLTKLQRREEAELRKQAAAKNLNRSKEEIEKGEAWKVLGKRGCKRIQLVQLYRDEIVLETGEVRIKVAADVGSKRVRSPGQSPLRPRNKQRIEPGEFGDSPGVISH